jgi:hypothetical protein
VVGGVKEEEILRAMDGLFGKIKYDPPTGPQYMYASLGAQESMAKAYGIKWYPHPDDPHCLCSEPWTQTMLDEWSGL